MMMASSSQLTALLGVVLFLVALISCSDGLDSVSNITVDDIQQTSFAVRWVWNMDNDDNFNLSGSRIVTSLTDETVVHAVDVFEIINNYTVDENLTSWEIYQCCIKPIVLNGSVEVDNVSETCSEMFVTLYDPWTPRAQIAVIISLALILSALIAIAINVAIPRSNQRTFQLDDLPDDDDDYKNDVLSSRDKNANENLGFVHDEDADSVVNDWNAAAAKAATSTARPTIVDKRWSTTSGDRPSAYGPIPEATNAGSAANESVIDGSSIGHGAAGYGGEYDEEGIIAGSTIDDAFVDYLIHSVDPDPVDMRESVYHDNEDGGHYPRYAGDQGGSDHVVWPAPVHESDYELPNNAHIHAVVGRVDDDYY